MIRLKDQERVSKLILDLGKATKSLVTNALEISYFSRGAWSYETVMNMSAVEREIAVEFIKKRLEIAEKSPYPVY